MRFEITRLEFAIRVDHSTLLRVGRWGGGVQTAGRPDLDSSVPICPFPGSSKWRFAALRFVHSQDIREVRGPNAFKTRLKYTCHEIALSVTRQTCTWNCPVFCPFWDIPDFFGVSPFCGGFPCPFLFLSLVKGPTREIPVGSRTIEKPPGLGNPPSGFSQTRGEEIEGWGKAPQDLPRDFK